MKLNKSVQNEWGTNIGLLCAIKNYYIKSLAAIVNKKRQEKEAITKRIIHFYLNSCNISKNKLIPILKKNQKKYSIQRYQKVWIFKICWI